MTKQNTKKLGFFQDLKVNKNKYITILVIALLVQLFYTLKLSTELPQQTNITNKQKETHTEKPKNESINPQKNIDSTKTGKSFFDQYLTLHEDVPEEEENLYTCLQNKKIPDDCFVDFQDDLNEVLYQGIASALKNEDSPEDNDLESCLIGSAYKNTKYIQRICVGSQDCISERLDGNQEYLFSEIKTCIEKYIK